jgi:hypothetical protein
MCQSGELKAYKLRNLESSPWRISYEAVISYLEAMHGRAGLETRF